MLPSPGPYRFGDFTFDPDSGELSGASGATRLQPQVAALLAVLIEHAGAVVSRAELQARLWPETNVEFDDGLNFCVRQLRLALGDDASSPRYVETLPRRGYRFLPPVTTGQAGARRARRSRRWIVAPVVAIVFAGLVALFYHQGRLPGQHAGRERIVLAVLLFNADTADPMMAAYRRRLYDQIVAAAAVEPLWETVKDPAAGATHVLSGSLARQGNSVRLFAQLVLARGRRHLWADNTLDSYAFSGNSTIQADRIEKSVARVLGSVASK